MKSHTSTSKRPVARFALIVIVVGGIAALFLYCGSWLTPHALTPARIIDRFEQVNGRQSGFRRNHAKGVCFSGYFDSNGNGAAICKAAVFASGRVPVIGRFALAGGNPFIGDSAQNVRSMAVLFKLPTGEQWRTGMNSIPVFPVATPRAFYDQLAASAPDPATGRPDREKLRTFLDTYPESVNALRLINSREVSSGFENSTYNSLNAFRFTSTDGQVSNVRWSMVSEQPFEAAPRMTSADKNYLFDALIASVRQHPLRWRLMVTVAQAGDPTSDATLPWPPDRQQIDTGVLTVDKIESEDTSPARDINFDPLILPVGIAGSDDPLLAARSAAYSVSFIRREGEKKQPSAVSSTEAGK